jgi:hypothetical protein
MKRCRIARFRNKRTIGLISVPLELTTHLGVGLTVRGAARVAHIRDIGDLAVEDEKLPFRNVGLQQSGVAHERNAVLKLGRLAVVLISAEH